MTTAHEVSAAIRALMAHPEDLDLARHLVSLSRQDPNALLQGQREVVEAPGYVAPYPFVAPVTPAPFRHNLSMAPPWKVHRPTSLGDLAAAMRDAIAQRRSMRALGGAWGFSNVAATDGLLLDLAALDAEVPIDTSQLAHGVDASVLHHVQAGATIADLNVALEKKGRALINQPGFEGLTFVGAMSCGGHGSGIDIGPLSAHVRALTLYTVDKNEHLRRLRVEPFHGAISRADARYPDVDEVLFDDDLFHACTVAMGTLGVITSVVIETRAFFLLRESRTLHRWSDLRPHLDATVRDANVHSVHLWVNPYEVGGARQVVLSRYTYDVGPRHGARPWSYAFGGSQALADVIVFVVRHIPDALPALMRLSLEATVDHDVVMPCYEALNFGPPNKLRVLAASSGVDATRAADVVDAIGAFAAQSFATRRLMTSPVGLRWVRASGAPLSPQFGRETCMVEVPLLGGTPHAEETLGAYLEMMFARFGARPHWGQYNPMNHARLVALYPALARFGTAFRALNPLGYWDNDFTKQVGLGALRT